MSRENLPIINDVELKARHVTFNCNKEQEAKDEENSLNNSEAIEEEIDDALDEGYMGMQCTLERGYSLTEWNGGNDKRLEDYYDNSLTYQHSSPSYYKNAKEVVFSNKKFKPNSVMTIDDVGPISYITSSWMTPLAWKTYKKGICMDDLSLTSPYDMCEYNTQRLKFHWTEEVKNNPGSDRKFLRAIWRFFRTRFICAFIFAFFKVLLRFIRIAIVMRAIIQWISSDEPLYVGIYLTIILLGLEALYIVFNTADWLTGIRTGIRLRAACYGILYEKILRLSISDSKKMGQIVNMFSSDAFRLYNMVTLQHQLFLEPLNIIVTAIYTCWVLSPWSLLGILLFGLIYPVQYFFTRLRHHYRKKTATLTDRRMQLLTEVITCIKLIKMYAWEEIFIENVKESREKEKSSYEKLFFVNFSMFEIITSFPMVIGIATLLIHTAAGNNLTADQALPFLALMIGPARMSTIFMNHAANAIAEGIAALKRIQSILLIEEIETYTSETSSAEIAVEIENASFSHSKVEEFTNRSEKSQEEIGSEGDCPSSSEPLVPQDPRVLKDISISIKKGNLVGICGRVASGKSSLLYGIMNQLKLLEGKVAIRGSFAYVSQQAWILNGTLRENIILQGHFDPKRYYKVVDACSLSQDIASLAQGDSSMIGEHGVTLSGGQKQRISLARALYADKEVYLLDDPLSAIDANVCHHIFNNAIKKILKGKTILFVSHHLQYFPHCQQVIFLNEGRVMECGSHAELISLGGEYASIYKAKIETTHSADKRDEDGHFPLTSPKAQKNADVRRSPKEPQKSEKPFKGLQMKKEDIRKGSIPFFVYHTYFQNAGGFFVCFLVLCSFIITAGASTFSAWWLSYWLQASSQYMNSTDDSFNSTQSFEEDITDDPNMWFYQLIYGLSIVIILITALFEGFVYTKVVFRASSNLLMNLFLKILRSPCSLFDSTPSGQIINLFSKDMDEVDDSLTLQLSNFLRMGCMVVAALIVVSLVFPYFLIPLVFISCVFFFIWRIFSQFCCEIKRLENVSKSPLFGHLNTTLQGLSSISAYNRQAMFFKRFVYLFDENNNAFFFYCLSTRWLSFRLDFLVVIIIMCTLIFTILLRSYVNAAFIGLALAYSLQLTGLFHNTARTATDVKARFTSVQRLVNSTKELVSEAPLTIAGSAPEQGWPSLGKISFSNVRLKYFFDAPLVLKGLTFDVSSQEKIGVVGRTGAGKSSLGVALLRLAEISDGHIIIDGVDITRIGLKDLRSALSVIPQDPVLFAGTVRFNLDPFSKRSDEDLWQALEKTHMKAKIGSLSEGLLAPVVFNGENFSVGERQLICLTRVILRKSKVIFLDEATAGIDTETDLKIQKTIQEAFKDCTVITVAHRINTIIESSRILTMSDGCVAEFDTPSNLLAKDSLFSQLVKASDFSQL